jgi:hypothetical protein
MLNLPVSQFGKETKQQTSLAAKPLHHVSQFLLEKE